MTADVIVLLLIVACILLSMGVYRMSAAGRGSQDKTGRGGSFVLGFWVRNWFYWFIRPLTRVSLALGLSPFFYNVFAVACGVAGMVFLMFGQLPAAGWLALASGLADVMDGEIARARSLANERGAFLDSTLDRFTEFAVFIGLAAFYGGGWRSIAVVVALGGSLLVSYTRARGESVGVLCKLGVMQRAERILLLGLGAILDPAIGNAAGWATGAVVAGIIVLIALGTVGTAVYRTVWIARELS